MIIRRLMIGVLLASALPAIAAEPVRHIGIYVQPFYEAGGSLDLEAIKPRLRKQ